MVTKYDKEQLVESRQFTGIQRDLLMVLLQNGKRYSIEECNKMLKKEQRREIK